AAGELIPAALAAVCKGGVVVCAGIHMSQIPAFSYDLLWGERVVRSVANLTRQDAREFLALAARTPIRTEVHGYRLPGTPQGPQGLRFGRFGGGPVIGLAPPANRRKCQLLTTRRLFDFCHRTEDRRCPSYGSAPVGTAVGATRKGSL